MNNRKKQLNSIKKKMMAATSMLLVASIMMVSSTYAWFTLSTAPEVKGISTTVGANGNLEIALANGSKDGSTIESNVGDSTASGNVVTAANITWGNLVDLADASYGLNDIVLQPAALSEITVTGTDGNYQAVEANILKTPSYGADGRVSELVKNSTTAYYVNDNWVEGTEENPGYGVRAVGLLSGQSETTVAFREARAQLSQQAQSAKNAASAALVANGDTLGNIIIKKALNDAPTFTTEEIDALGAMIGGLEKTMAYIDKAIQYGALGRAASSDFSDTVKYEAIKSAIAATDATAEDVLEVFYGTTTKDTDGTISTTPGTIPAEGTTDVLAKAYNKYVDTAADIASAKSTYTSVKSANTTGSYSWSDITPALTALVDYDNVKVNGMGVDEVKAKLSELVNSALKGGIKVTMPTGTGVIADVADLAGDYSAGITLKNVKYGSIEVAELPATMNTASTVNPDHISQVSAYILSKGAMSSGEGAAAGATFTDAYAYIIDLFFRTNVAGSNLLLQTDAVDRVYSDQTEGATQGKGSTMIFTTENTATFSVPQMKQLMECVKLVFVDENNAILAKGMLDVASATDTAAGTTGTVEAKINLYTETTVDNVTTVTKLEGENAVIAGLTQNEAKMVSVIVYLDGENVDNSMVANAATSMTGTLNLQFASDAQLVPMENSQLRDLPTGEATPAPTATPDGE